MSKVPEDTIQSIKDAFGANSQLLDKLNYYEKSMYYGRFYFPGPLQDYSEFHNNDVNDRVYYLRDPRYLKDYVEEAMNKNYEQYVIVASIVTSPYTTLTKFKSESIMKLNDYCSNGYIKRWDTGYIEITSEKYLDEILSLFASIEFFDKYDVITSMYKENSNMSPLRRVFKTTNELKQFINKYLQDGSLDDYIKALENKINDSMDHFIESNNGYFAPRALSFTDEDIVAEYDNVLKEYQNELREIWDKISDIPYLQICTNQASTSGEVKDTTISQNVSCILNVTEGAVTSESQKIFDISQKEVQKEMEKNNTPENTPNDTQDNNDKDDTPNVAPDNAQDNDKENSPNNTPDNKPDNTPNNKPNNLPDNKPDNKPDNSPNNSPDNSPNNTPGDAQDNENDNTPNNTQNNAQDNENDNAPNNAQDNENDNTPDNKPDNASMKTLLIIVIIILSIILGFITVYIIKMNMKNEIQNISEVI